jgi:hypothetical protein
MVKAIAILTTLVAIGISYFSAQALQNLLIQLAN